MTDTASAVNSPLDILTVTRKVFAASHWTEGTFSTKKWDAEAGEDSVKVVGCSVGGLRYAALAPMDHALDETWMFANFHSLGGGPLAPDAESEEGARNYLRAIEYLYEVVTPRLYEDYLHDVEEATQDDEDWDVWRRISNVEDVIVTWNDSRAYDASTDDEERRLGTVSDEILPAFDKAIENAARDAAQTQINTSEGS